MPDKKNGGGNGDGGGKGAKVGEWVLYQPTRLNWLRGGGWQLPALVHWANEDSEEGAANLVVFVTADARDHVLNATYGEADGQYMKLGEQSKTAKALKQAMEDAKKAAEESAKKKPEGGFPTAQTQLEADQAKAIAQYQYPQPPPE